MIKAQHDTTFIIPYRQMRTNVIIGQSKVKGKTVMQLLSGNMLIIEAYLPIHTISIYTLRAFTARDGNILFVNALSKITRGIADFYGT